MALVLYGKKTIFFNAGPLVNGATAIRAIQHPPKTQKPKNLLTHAKRQAFA